MGVALFLEPANVSVEPGQQASIRIRVRNTGRVVDRVKLTVLGSRAAWATITPPSVNLYPGTEGTATLVFAPARDPSSTAGAVPYAVRAASTEDPVGSEIEEGTLTIAAFRVVTASLVPVTSYGARIGRHELHVANGGNAPLRLTLEATDPDELLTLAFRTPELTLAPGASAEVDLTVEPTGEIGHVPATRRPFSVRALDETGTPVAAVTGGFELQRTAAR